MCWLSFNGQHVPVKGLSNVSVIGDTAEQLLVYSFAGFLLLNDSKNTVVQMLVEILCIPEGGRAGGTFSCDITRSDGWFLSRTARALLAAVGRILFNTVHGGKVSLEDIRSVEALFGGRSRARAESTHHITLVVGEGVSILIVFAGEPFLMVRTGRNWALFRPLRLMGQHMCFQVFEQSAAAWMKTSIALASVVKGSRTSRRARRMAGIRMI